MKLKGLLHVTFAYVVTLGVAWATLQALGENPIWDMFWADIAATIAIFVFSRLYKNSSFYDAYWSVVPIVIACWWLSFAEPDANTTRQILVGLLVLAWGVRLTWNWARGWDGLHHEDWRYVRIRERTGVLYWPTSFAGIHLMPTLWVFLGCLPLFPALSAGTSPAPPSPPSASTRR